MGHGASRLWTPKHSGKHCLCVFISYTALFQPDRISSWRAHWWVLVQEADFLIDKATVQDVAAVLGRRLCLMDESSDCVEVLQYHLLLMFRHATLLPHSCATQSTKSVQHWMLCWFHSATWCKESCSRILCVPGSKMGLASTKGYLIAVQVLQELSENLCRLVLQACPCSLEYQISVLPSSLHDACIHTAMPGMLSRGAVDLNACCVSTYTATRVLHELVRLPPVRCVRLTMLSSIPAISNEAASLHR